jgi:hypothetical protein
MRLRALLPILVLSGCQYSWDPAQLEANIVRPGNFKAGSGVIQSVGVLRGENPGAKDPNFYRLLLHMDPGGGGTQSVDVDRGGFMPGEAVELTNDGRVVRVTGTTLNLKR